MFVLYTVSQMATEQLKPHLVSMLQLLNEKLNDTQNYMVPYYAIRSVNVSMSEQVWTTDMGKNLSLIAQIALSILWSTVKTLYEQGG